MIQSKFSYLLGLILGALVLFSACDSHRIIDEHTEFPSQAWDWNDSISFTFNISDTVQAYNVYVNLRHTGAYAFSNIWVMVHTDFPDGKHLSQRVELPLADKTGRWYAKSMSDMYDQQVLIQANALFPRKGDYTFTLKQDMRVNPLEAVQAAGIRVEKAAPKPDRKPKSQS